MLAAGLVSMTSPAFSAETSLDDRKVLELPFDGTLADVSPKANTPSMQKGTAGYVTGLSGQAFNFNGSNAVNLGTAAHLQPADLSVSFWFKPNVAMAGEQVFTWNKQAYNSDGWYLTSESNTTPLALSIGPSTGQPYKVAVDAPRSTFFPTDQWTHIVATYDKASKNVAIYRNGVRQSTVVKFPVAGTATGVLGSESTTTKTLGYNGPLYNGAHLNGLLDDYTVYDGVASTTDVVALTKAHNPTFDAGAVAQSDLDAVTVPPSVSTNFTVPLEGSKGTAISWASSNSAAIAISGGAATVTPPSSSPVTVALTATGTYGGSNPVTKTFNVEVLPEGLESSVYLLEAGLTDVTVQDPYLVNGNQKTIDYLLSLDPEKFLFSFYKQAGLTPTTAAGYGGWERETGTRFQGHFFGHYISALSQAYATTTDPTTKSALLAKLTAAVDGLKRCQDAYAAKDPANAGFVSPFPVTYLPAGADGLLVPFYNLHKVVAGLLEAHDNAPANVSATALSVADGFGTWITNWAGRQANPAALLGTEYGGMNEALYELYSITEKPAHKRAAEYFDEVTLFQKLAAGQDVLNGLHANTTIPKLVGALKRYTVFTDNPRLYATLTDAEKSSLTMYRTAAENFWPIVHDHHTYANGGNSQSEHFHAPDTLHQYATNGQTTGYGENSTSEGCNEYNMLKLSRALFQVTKDVKYADYYEHAFINSVLPIQNPETGMVTYFQPMAAGYAKIFGHEQDEFWCDHGTGIESFTKLGDSIYFEDTTSVYVNQFRTSVLRSAAHNLTLTQTADVPNKETVTLQVAGLDGGAVADGTSIRLRIPSWVNGTPTLSINGVATDIAPLTSAGYVVVPVAAGDAISYTLPAKVTVDDETENANWVAFKYGPVLLATELNRNNVDAAYTAGVLVRMSTADKTVNSNVVVQDAVAWKAGIENNLVRNENGVNANGVETMRFSLRNVDTASAALTFEPYYSLYNARYAIYMTLVQPDSPEAQALIRREKEQLRIDETTIDSLTSFDNNNSEADKNYKYNKSAVGTHLGQPYRDGQRATDAYFQYDMIVDPTLEKNYLGVRYFGGDNGRTFDVYLNDVLLKHETITNANGASSWYIQYDQIPQAVLDGIAAKDSYKRDQNGNYVLDANGAKIPVVTVRFQGNGISFVGGVYGVYTTTTSTFDTNAELKALTSDTGVLSPALAAGVHSYTLTVPTDATSVALDVDPAVPSGLVTIGDILIDDTKPRTITVNAGTEPTNVMLTSYAQDHVTKVSYQIAIVRAEPKPVLALTATAIGQCVKGKVVLTVEVRNDEAVPMSLTLTSAYGQKSVKAVKPGKSTVQTFPTRAASIPAGTVKVEATATVGGQLVTYAADVAYAERACG